jgi:hypothetical protein
MNRGKIESEQAIQDGSICFLFAFRLVHEPTQGVVLIRWSLG